MMRTQWPCSKCGFAYSSTWRTEHPSKPVICDACRSMEKNDYDDEQEEVDDESKSSSHESEHSSTQIIRHPHSVSMHHFIQDHDIVFGNLSFYETKIRIVYGQRSFGFQDHDHDFYGVSSSKSLLEDGMQIQHENDNGVFARKETTLWDPKSVNKKRRSKLHQYTQSPVERFVNQLQYQVLQDPKLNNISANGHLLPYERPKYDDVLIYEKCNFISQDEIGVGSVLLSPTSKNINKEPFTTVRRVKIEPYTRDVDCACNLFDVPIRGPYV